MLPQVQLTPAQIAKMAESPVSYNVSGVSVTCTSLFGTMGQKARMPHVPALLAWRYADLEVLQKGMAMAAELSWKEDVSGLQQLLRISNKASS